MVLELKDAVVVLVAQHAAILANPLYIALLAVIKICGFGLLPTVSETEHVYLYWNALNFYPLAA